MSTTSRHGTTTPMRRELARSTATFAASMLIIVGICQILVGVAAVAKDSVLVTSADYSYQLDISAWGWIHIVIGALAVGVGVGALYQQWWARVGGIMVGALGIMSNFLFLPYFPLWALILIAFYVFIIWALAYQINTDD
jgi:hypothetical protein